MPNPDVNSLYFRKIQALARFGTLEPVFHPIVPLPWTGDTVVIHEALARIRTKEGLALSPSEFFYTEGLSGGIHPADLDYVMLHLLPQLLAHHHEAQLSLNAAPSSLTCDSYYDLLRTMVRGREFNLNQVMLEITEDALEVAEEEVLLLNRIEELRSEGLRIALDQFGDGGNGISRIAESHFDMVKISRSIDITTPRGRVLAESLVNLLKTLSSPELSGDLGGRLTSICFETIESAAQLDQAIYLGANYVQGYLLAQPSPTLWDYDTLVARIDQALNQFLSNTPLIDSDVFQ